MKKYSKLIPQALRELMEEKNIKQKDIVHRTELPKSYISMLLNGSRTPEIEKLRLICSAMGMSLSTLFLKASQLEVGIDDVVKKERLSKAYELLAELDSEIYGNDDNDSDEHL